MKISSVTEMRELDRTAIETYGIKEELLMENAGDALYFVILQKMGILCRRFVVFCGLGNNGGDGFVVARKLHSNGGLVKVFILGDQKKYRGAAKLNLDILKRLPVEMVEVQDAASVHTDTVHCHAVVDAMLGTGLEREVKGLYGDIIEGINDSGKTVFSADIPSGVSGDTGEVMGIAVKADYTVTFGLPKLGNLLFPGYDLCGKLYVTHISFPPQLYDSNDLKVSITPHIRLPRRNPDAHKGSVGQVLFIAGAANYYGAPYFSALSFLKAGGGYSRLAAPESITPFIANKGSEIVLLPQEETASGSIALKNKDKLLELGNRMDMVVMGPGLSLDTETQELARALVKDLKVPLLLDGDGITALCSDLELLNKREKETVLTPHLGEMARITGIDTPEIAHDRTTILQQTAETLRTIIVLKGAHSLVGFPDRRVFMNMSGNQGMATAGSGDVLTGAIAAMFGLGLDIEGAVLKGVFIHGLAGDLAAESKGMDGMTAQDILEHLPLALKGDREGLSENLAQCYGGLKVI
ncbi:MAG: NAD(P)H-hydrate dehydratase [Deltaproteobacteria bacterium]|nr:NAD(P)H-hydrate dehydratase [Deltaproteobacteria bacterium]